MPYPLNREGEPIMLESPKTIEEAVQRIAAAGKDPLLVELIIQLLNAVDVFTRQGKKQNAEKFLEELSQITE